MGIEAAKILLPKVQGNEQDNKKNSKQQCFGRVLCCTIAENDKFMSQALGLRRQRFRPSIPNLLWQYSFWCNYQSDRLAQLNPVIDHFSPPMNSRKKCSYGSISSENYSSS